MNNREEITEKERARERKEEEEEEKEDFRKRRRNANKSIVDYEMQFNQASFFSLHLTSPPLLSLFFLVLSHSPSLPPCVSFSSPLDAYETAGKHFRRALELVPGLGMAANNIAVCNLYRGSLREVGYEIGIRA